MSPKCHVGNLKARLKRRNNNNFYFATEFDRGGEILFSEAKLAPSGNTENEDVAI
jgi:hypothetical protein